jgi:hypothetical protein
VSGCTCPTPRGCRDFGIGVENRTDTATSRGSESRFLSKFRRGVDLQTVIAGDPKVVQGLLRHNSIKVTMGIYDEAMSDEKQMAPRKVLRLVTRKQDRTVMRTALGTGVPAST